MKARSSSQTPMSYGPTIDDLRTSISVRESEGIPRQDMLLRLTFRDASLIKRSPSVGVDEVSFADGYMRFLGVKIVVGPVALSSLEAPALPEPEVVAEPVKKPKARAKAKPKVAKVVAEAAVVEEAVEV